MEDDIPHFDIDVAADNYKKDFLPVLKKIKPDWREDDLVFKESPKEMSRGMINTMVRCYSNQNPEDSIMIRIVNTTMSGHVDRSAEVNCIKYLQKHDCAPKILATFKTGFCYEFIHGEVLNCLRLREEPIWRRLAEELAKIHAANVEEIPGFKKEIQFKATIDKMAQNYPETMRDPVKNEIFKKYLSDKETMTKEADETWNHALNFENDLVLTHNDTRAENIVWNGKTGIAKLVDFELMAYNYRGAELAAHFQRFGGFNPTDYSLIPDEEFQLQWIRVYLEKYYQVTGRNASDVTDKDVRRLYVQTRKFELVYLIMYAISGPAFHEMNIISGTKLDILGMAIDAYQQYYKKKEAIMGLKLPEENDQ